MMSITGKVAETSVQGVVARSPVLHNSPTVQRRQAVNALPCKYSSAGRLDRTAFAQPATVAKKVRLGVVAAAVEAEVQADERVPVTVITGFLGSGKTTLLNNILTKDHGKRIAVIENEFGEIDIDSELVAKKEILEGTSDTITTLSNGCLCCTVREDLVIALNKLWYRRKDFDHIVIETTGLANPSPIIHTFYNNEDLLERMQLDGVVTVVDAKHVEQHLNEEKEEGVVNEAVEQIAYADRIVLNKIDLVDEPSLRSLEVRIRAINKLADMHKTTRSNVPVDYVLGVGGFDLEAIERELDINIKPKQHSHSHSHEHGHECSGANCTHESHRHDHDHVHDCHDSDCTHESHKHEHAHGHECSGADCTHESHKLEHSHAHAEGSHSHSHSHSHGHEHHDNAHDCNDPSCNHESHSHAPQMVHDDKVSSISIVLDGDMDLDRINYSLGLLLRTRSEDIYRMKGLLSIRGSDHRFVYQGVHAMFEGAPDREWRPDEKRCNKMVFIGRYLDKEAFEEAFRSCLADNVAAEDSSRQPVAAGV